jgi:hypothetical protein
LRSLRLSRSSKHLILGYEVLPIATVLRHARQAQPRSTLADLDTDRISTGMVTASGASPTGAKDTASENRGIVAVAERHPSSFSA